MGNIVVCIAGASIVIDGIQADISPENITQTDLTNATFSQSTKDEPEEWEARFKGPTEKGDIVWVVTYTLDTEGVELTGIIPETIPLGVVVVSEPEFQIEAV